MTQVIWPVPPNRDGGYFFYDDQDYGYRDESSWDGDDWHNGIDFSNYPGGSEGIAIQSIAAGTVRFRGTDPDLGNIVKIDHAGGLQSWYCHMLDGSHTHLYQGASVSQGARVGNIGNTGLSFGAHLHLELHLNGSRIDPEAYIRANLGTSKRRVNVSDFSGDGYADVLGVNASGYLMYYPNNGLTLSPPVQIGNGWSTFKHVFAADFSGDGRADVFGVDSTGDLIWWVNNSGKLGTPVQIGNGWSTFKHVFAADFSGDGHADVFGVDSAGDLFWWPNNGLKLSPPIQLGHGWGTFKHVFAADFSGDGHADILGVDSVGDLYWYPNNGLKLSPRIKIGNGWGDFKHVWAADFNGDWRADVLGVDAAGDLYWYANSSQSLAAPVKIGNGWGSFLHVM